ncbi:ABC transporter permease [Streptomyces carpaticus]|uniref:Transport permease protein n=2 Tax=Streptomyces TaxID=1883 RepID=A0A1I6W3J2_9ACTN|nr:MULTISPECIES: ABC transporter permease [unclassified Streptomyces]MCK1813745.1 ABC transporter permease [Streptomyces sp. XM4011]QKV71027.1 ABC transporter permease [Streptomyces harbinensis]UWM51471.1 ABC transporter permease [Streptomyces carpaticus]SFT20540.1 ABC-2 type transport system permease protein [Streptomyces harbinensis]
MGDSALNRMTALVRQDIRLLLRDPAPLLIRTVMPLVIMGFMQPLFRAALQAGGAGTDVNGAEQGVPGMAVMFLFFMMNVVGFAMFREHGWNTWDRLRAGTARPVELLAARLVVLLAAAVLQLTVIFVAGGLLFGLRVSGSWLALVVVALPLALSVVMLGMALVVLCRTISQLSVVANILALVFAGLGGALTPQSAMPDWAVPFAPFAPSHWAMRGFNEAILHGGGVPDVLLPAGVLCLFAAGLAAVTLVFFRAEDRKLSWS